MKTYFLTTILLTTVLLSGLALAVDPIVLNNWGTGNLADVYDLTECDLTLSYNIDMSAIQTAGWAVTEVGLRQVGAPNLDPNLHGGWMQSNYISAISNPNLSNNDIHLLSKHGWLYQTYDATDASTLVTPYWSGDNYGFWFDRDGVDQWQALLWGFVNGGTYNTLGNYDVVISYHAIDADTGTMFATINGVQQGLYTAGWKNAQPEFYPAGRSFDGNMNNMQVFYGRGGGGGVVTLSNIQVTGCLADSDNDGVHDAQDLCPNTPAGAVVDPNNGCSAVQTCTLVNDYSLKNHGQYVSCVAKTLNDFVKLGLLTSSEKGEIVSEAAQSEIGK